MLKVIITGASGQDGYFLSKYFSRLNCRVVGTVRNSSSKYTGGRFKYFDDLIHVDLQNSHQVSKLISDVRPTHILNMGAVANSWSQFVNPETILAVNLGAVVSMLETIKTLSLKTVFLQASSSEIFAGGARPPQSYCSRRIPRTIYGVSKIAADSVIDIYRKQFGINCYSAILFSHESPLRKEGFFSKRVVKQALDVVEGKSSTIQIYTPFAIRDWGYAGEYCKLLVDEILVGLGRNVILGSGRTTTVKEFTQCVCDALGLNYNDVVIENAMLPGRVVEDSVVVADSGCKYFIGAAPKKDLKYLVNLLIRYERYERRFNRKN